MTITITHIPFDTKKSSFSFEEFIDLIEEREDDVFARMIQEGHKDDLVSHEEIMQALLTK